MARALLRCLALSLGSALLLGPVLPGAAVAQTSMSPGYKFLDAVKKRDGATVEQMLGGGGAASLVNARDLSSGKSALHYVVEGRDETWLRYLLAKGANPDAADSGGTTPLMTAVRLNWQAGVEWLLRGGAPVDTTNRAGETALIQAVQLHNPTLVRLLLRAGANPDKRDHVAGMSARDYAGQDPRDAELKQLIETEAKPAKAEPKLDFSGQPIR